MPKTIELPKQSFLEMQLMLQGMNIQFESSEKVEELAMRQVFQEITMMNVNA